MSKADTQRLYDAISASLGGRIAGDTVLASCYHHLLQMMEDRGAREIVRCHTHAELARRIDDGEAVIACDVDGTRVHTYVDAEERMGVKFLRTVREAHADGDHLVFVSVEGPTPFTRKEASGTDVEFWRVNELLANPTRHKLVPEHRALSAVEVDALKHARCITDNQWPLLMSSDIIARWYRFRVGTVVRILRRGIACEEGFYYRKVV